MKINRPAKFVAIAPSVVEAAPAESVEPAPTVPAEAPPEPSVPIHAPDSLEPVKPEAGDNINTELNAPGEEGRIGPYRLKYDPNSMTPLVIERNEGGGGAKMRSFMRTIESGDSRILVYVVRLNTKPADGETETGTAQAEPEPEVETKADA